MTPPFAKHCSRRNPRQRSAKLALDNATLDAQRQQRLETAGAVAPRDVEAAQRALAAAQAAMADAQSRLTAAQQQLGKTTFRAPFDGLVSERPGERRRCRAAGHRDRDCRESREHAPRGVGAGGAAVFAQDRHAGNFHREWLWNADVHGTHRSHQSDGRSGDAPGARVRDDPEREEHARWWTVRRWPRGHGEPAGRS